MDALIDEVLETLMHSAIWRSTAHLSLTTLIIIAVITFAILAYRRSKNKSLGRRSSRRRGLRYRSRYRKWIKLYDKYDIFDFRTQL